MTCGFLNSAGTDLDSLFYANNGNAGAIGFQCSNGQDLGNRFTNANTLGYAVGYQNSAGTDIGYLRGAGSPPVFTAYNATLNNLYNLKTSCSHIIFSHKQRYIRGYLYVTGSCSGFGNNAPTWQVCICHYHTEQNDVHNYRLAVQADSTANIQPSSCLLDLHDSPLSLATNTESPWQTVKNDAGGASRAMNVAFGLYSINSKGDYSIGDCIRVYQRFYNSIGSTPWVQNSFNLGS